MDGMLQNNINRQYPVNARFVDKDDVADNDDDLVIFQSPVTFTLALAQARKGQNLFLKALDTVGGAVTVIAQPGETIDSSPSVTLVGNGDEQQSFILKSDGVSSWKILGCCDGATPPSEGACENTVTIQASDPFATLPAPGAGGEIQLLANTIYQFCGDVDIGDSFLQLTNNTVACGMDPLVDSVSSSGQNTILMPEGGTVKDIAVRNTSGPAGEALVLGGDGQNVVNAIFFNMAVGTLEATGIRMSGNIGGVSVARMSFTNSSNPIRIGSAAPTLFGAISIDQIIASNLGSSFTGVQIDANVGMQSFSISQSVMTGTSASDIGINIDSLGIQRIRSSSCAYLGDGIPSQIAQTPPLPTPATLGNAVQSESVGCVGFENSLQRGSIQVVNRLTEIPAGGGTLVPIGNGINPGSTFTLDPSSVRVSLVGTTAENQFLQFDCDASYSAIVAVSISVQVAVGITFTPRVISAQLEIDGALSGAPFQATTPDFTTAAPVSLSFSSAVELNKNSQVRVLISNDTDGVDLLVVAARITVA